MVAAIKRRARGECAVSSAIVRLYQKKRKPFPANVAVDFCYNWERSAEHGSKECVLLNFVCFGLICSKWLNGLLPFLLGASSCAAKR
jgi:hypothetical protein